MSRSRLDLPTPLERRDLILQRVTSSYKRGLRGETVLRLFGDLTLDQRHAVSVTLDVMVKQGLLWRVGKRGAARYYPAPKDPRFKPTVLVLSFPQLRAMLGKPPRGPVERAEIRGLLWKEVHYQGRHGSFATYHLVAPFREVFGREPLPIGKLADRPCPHTCDRHRPPHLCTLYLGHLGAPSFIGPCEATA